MIDMVESDQNIKLTEYVLRYSWSYRLQPKSMSLLKMLTTIVVTVMTQVLGV